MRSQDSVTIAMHIDWISFSLLKFFGTLRSQFPLEFALPHDLRQKDPTSETSYVVIDRLEHSPSAVALAPSESRTTRVGPDTGNQSLHVTCIIISKFHATGLYDRVPDRVHSMGDLVFSSLITEKVRVYN